MDVDAGKHLLHAETWKQVGGAAAVLAIVISVVHISRHLRYNKSKEIKRCTLRILLLVPFYALDCFLSLVLSGGEREWPYLLTAFREFYEAVVLSAFMQLVLTFLGRRKDGSMGGPQAVGEAFCTAMRKPSHESMSSRLAFIPVIYSPGASFVSGVLIGILQYALVMVVVLVADVSIWFWWGAQIRLLCTGGPFCVWKIPFYMKAVSCGWAMYNLTLFYFEAKMCKELRERLELIHPHNKFFSVKMIIFFTFFQKLIVSTILKDWFHMFDIFAGGPQHWSPDVVAEGLQTFLLCVEMLLFAIWHMQAYPVDEFNRLDAAIALRAAIGKGSRLDLKSAVQEAVDAGLGREPDPSDRMGLEWKALLLQARELLEKLYPEVQFEGQTSEFVLRTSRAATVHIAVDAQSRRLCITSFGEGGIETGESDELQVTLMEPTGIAWRKETFMPQTKMLSMSEDLAVFAHNLCSPSGEVGFLGTCAMYKDILSLRRCAREQRRAVKLLRSVERNTAGAGKLLPSDAEIERAFRAFDRDGDNTVTRQKFLNVFVSAADGGDEAEASRMLDSMGLREGSELGYDAFKTFVGRSANPNLAAPLLSNAVA